MDQREVQRLVGAAGLGADVDTGEALQQAGQARPHQGVVIDDQHAHQPVSPCDRAGPVDEGYAKAVRSRPRIAA